ncbi:UDP-N-acetylmuramoyl-L-alanyl-D-glutamate--2,6-diaminopimelate ligase [Pseudactinotalea sp.]|uniref:UDP-N-acetylmuramoyl-L-alanyl-D-glutamate--2, 6-diaminopimelate ligase n=1 Tax=Pseudactinotalea sp. TaxID=1926260 RepID=UPI003B3AC615
MQLRDLADAVGAPLTDLPDLEVTAITHNAAWVTPGAAYVAIRGSRVDGHAFVEAAVAAGAVAVIGEGMADGVRCPVPYLVAVSARAALADGAAALTGNPSRALRVVGVTGTDGKTTTSWLTRHLLRAAGLGTGLLSTVGYELADGALHHFPAHFTTPEAPELQRVLGELVSTGAQAVVLEASSHALAMDRVRAVDWDVAVWTHLTSEHLDFHGTVENYFADKAKLVERSPFAVLNADDPWTSQLHGRAPAETTYSADGGDAAWVAHNIGELPDGLRFAVDSPLGRLDARLPMIGRFNVANALAAMAAAHHLGATAEQLLAGLRTFTGVPGRMELVPGRAEQDPRVIVDFAHTPPSLEKALATVRATTERELWVVIGSAGGPRDPSKRAPLGEVASRLADHAIFTEEDHRDTPLQDILDEMQRGANGPGTTTSIGDRTAAIRYAVEHARPGDTVVLAGKGPEDTLERDTETIPWDEVAEAAAALALRL